VQHPVPAATGSAGMVGSIDRRASEAGIGMLAGGGNAVDAAVATAASTALPPPRFSPWWHRTPAAWAATCSPWSAWARVLRCA